MPLSALQSIRDSSQLNLPLHGRRLRQKSSSSPSNIISLKFKGASRTRNGKTAEDPSTSIFERQASDNYASPTPSPPNSAQGGWWRRGSRDVSASLSMGLTSSASVLVGAGNGAGFAEVWDAFARRGSRAGTEDSDEEGRAVRDKGKDRAREEETVLVVLDMLDTSGELSLWRRCRSSPDAEHSKHARTSYASSTVMPRQRATQPSSRLAPPHTLLLLPQSSSALEPRLQRCQEPRLLVLHQATPSLRHLHLRIHWIYRLHHIRQPLLRH